MTDDVHEHELNAYVDGTLPEARRLEVEAWLAAHPADAARVQAWSDQNQSLHATFDAVLNEPLPLNLVRATLRPALPVPFRAVAALLAMMATGLVGYAIGLNAEQAPAAPVYLARDAAIAHAVFSPESRHPVEVDAAHADHLVAWLSKRVGTQLQAPDFSAQGFDLLGGRLLSGETGPVAQFMYQDRIERRVTLYVRRAVSGNKVTAFRHAAENGVDVFYWIDGDFGYALSGQIGRKAIQQLADAAYSQMIPASGKR
ncbi:MAG: anti-sigma factor [Thiobacillus sp.]|nr:anti-sigma factor [Thiobacillus sp.]MDP2056481.1 anti-sigma factor [Thiobacillus sp.]